MSLLATRMLEYRANSPHLDKYTARASRYGGFDVFAKQSEGATSIISPEMEMAAMTQVGRDLKVPVFDAKTITIGNTRTLTIADADNDSALLTISFTVLSWGFTQVPTRFINNEIGMQRDWNRKFEDRLYAVGNSLEALCLTALDTNKTQQFGDELIYTNTANVLTAAQANGDRIIGDLGPLMHANDFFGQLDVVGNTGLESRMLEMSKYGLYNEKDETISFGQKNFHFTNQLANAVGNEATGYAINSSSVGLLFRPEAEALLATQMADGRRWGMDRLPLLDIPVSTYYYEGAVDDSGTHAGTAHLDRVRKQYFGWSIEVATVVAYNNDIANRANPIIKFAIAT